MINKLAAPLAVVAVFGFQLNLTARGGGGKLQLSPDQEFVTRALTSGTPPADRASAPGDGSRLLGHRRR